MRILLLLAVFPALAFSQKVAIEFDETRDFSDYKSFAIGLGKTKQQEPLKIKDHLADMVGKSVEKYPPKR